MIIGLAGKSGSGKNFLAQWLTHQGYYHFDLDLWAHQGLEECKDKICSHFEENLLNDDGSLSRKKLGIKVFSNNKKREELQNILYPWLEKKITEELNHKDKAILNGALLSESSLQYSCDVVFWIKAPFWIRFKRLKNRDHRNTKELLQRMISQRFLKPQLFSEQVDIHIVQNHRNPYKMYKRVSDILKILQQKDRKHGSRKERK